MRLENKSSTTARLTGPQLILLVKQFGQLTLN
jgi:hypothetical protein